MIQERDIVSDSPAPVTAWRAEEDTIVDVYWGLDEIEAALDE